MKKGLKISPNSLCYLETWSPYWWCWLLTDSGAVTKPPVRLFRVLSFFPNILPREDFRPFFLAAAADRAALSWAIS